LQVVKRTKPKYLVTDIDTNTLMVDVCISGFVSLFFLWHSQCRKSASTHT